MLKKILLYVFIILPASAVLYSCRTQRELPYLKDLPANTPISKVNTVPYEPLKLQANDEVQVTISSTSPEASQFFNLVAVSPSAVGGTTTTGQSQAINSYRVSTLGFITLPVLGDVKAAGLTTEELKSTITERLKEYLKDAVVTARLTNFKVTVMGEVQSPVVIPVNGQTINVLEAVGAAGDMTVFGIRTSVRVIRKLPDGSTEVAVLDFNKSSLLRSPYFQLKQNDIVYVQPSRTKGATGTKLYIWVSAGISLISIAATIFLVRH